jgi:hypothetical protein
MRKKMGQRDSSCNITWGIAGDFVYRFTVGWENVALHLLYRGLITLSIKIVEF